MRDNQLNIVENIPAWIYRQWKKTLRKPNDSIFLLRSLVGANHFWLYDVGHSFTTLY